MARWRILDHLMSHPFWVVDLSVPWTDGWYVLNPILGFQTCTAPEISIQTKEVREGNWYFPHISALNATISPITLTRGVSMFYGGRDFYKWAANTIKGKQRPRRDLMIIHYSTASLEKLKFHGSGVDENLAQLMVALGATTALAAQMSLKEAGALALSAGNVAGGRGLALLGVPSHETIRIPARMWLMKKCIPTRWKAGTDFDATSAGVSVAELEVQPHEVLERSMGFGGGS